ncbi:hypothetical protein LINPERHAP2_LOCUS131, partial [Linum perenne]
FFKSNFTTLSLSLSVTENRRPLSQSFDAGDASALDGVLSVLGKPSFTNLDNRRFKCVETGHEVVDKDKESYSQSKKCRLGLIDHALSNRKPPLNIFKQDPLIRLKLVCKLTGDTVNKSEEHIWKHINGRRFLNKLEQKETGKLVPNGKASEEKGKKEDGDENEKKTKKKQLQKKGKSIEKIITEMRDTSPAM